MPINDAVLPPERTDGTLYDEYAEKMMDLCNQGLRAQIMKDQAEFERVWELIEEARKE